MTRAGKSQIVRIFGAQGQEDGVVYDSSQAGGRTEMKNDRDGGMQL